MTKVLQYLGEEPKSEKSEEQKIRQKNKKLAKKANKENVIIDPTVKSQQSSLEDPQSPDSKSENLEHVQDILDKNTDETDIEPTFATPEDSKSSNADHANEGLDDQIAEVANIGMSGSSTEISTYIDSLELENRCLKVSQQFFETIKNENTNLKTELEKLKKESFEKQIFESTKKENEILKQQLKDLQNILANEEHKLQNLKESTEELQKCKICMEGKLEIVFIPCGHLFSCTYCAPSCKNCPLCRKPAKHMKIYLP